MGKAFKQRVDAHKEPNLIQVMVQSFYITSYAVGRHALETADIVIEPDLAQISAADFAKAPELITRGLEAAQKAIPEIRRKLKI
jgi:predicted acylesterase/phospholipase RssA